MNKKLNQPNVIWVLSSTLLLANIGSAQGAGSTLYEPRDPQGRAVVTEMVPHARSVGSSPADETPEAALERQARAILAELQRTYPFNAKTDLGPGFEDHLRGDESRPWENHLTDDVQETLQILRGEKTKEELERGDFNEGSELMGIASRLGSVWVKYDEIPDLSLRMTIRAAFLGYAPATYNIGRWYREGILGLEIDKTKECVLKKFALEGRGLNSIEWLKGTLEGEEREEAGLGHE